jgi:hypothetical protein
MPISKMGGKAVRARKLSDKPKASLARYGKATAMTAPTKKGTPTKKKGIGNAKSGAVPMSSVKASAMAKKKASSKSSFKRGY